MNPSNVNHSAAPAGTNREPAGVPTGGRFAVGAQNEPVPVSPISVGSGAEAAPQPAPNAAFTAWERGALARRRDSASSVPEAEAALREAAAHFTPTAERLAFLFEGGQLTFDAAFDKNSVPVQSDELTVVANQIAAELRDEDDLRAGFENQYELGYSTVFALDLTTPQEKPPLAEIVRQLDKEQAVLTAQQARMVRIAEQGVRAAVAGIEGAAVVRTVDESDYGSESSILVPQQILDKDGTVLWNRRSGKMPELDRMVRGLAVGEEWPKSLTFVSEGRMDFTL